MINKSEFEHIIRDFIYLDYPAEVEILYINFTISYFISEEGEGCNFGGYYVSSGKHIPIDLRKIGKMNCRQLSERIKLFCRSYLDSKKWNTFEIKFGQDNSVSYNFRKEKIE